MQSPLPEKQEASSAELGSAAPVPMEEVDVALKPKEMEWWELKPSKPLPARMVLTPMSANIVLGHVRTVQVCFKILNEYWCDRGPCMTRDAIFLTSYLFNDVIKHLYAKEQLSTTEFYLFHTVMYHLPAWVNQWCRVPLRGESAEEFRAFSLALKKEALKAAKCLRLLGHSERVYKENQALFQCLDAVAHPLFPVIPERV